MMSYKHFTAVERKEIHVLLKKHYSLRFIAEALRKNVSSVSREIDRNKVRGVYDPMKAENKYRRKRLYSKHKGMKIRKIKGLEEYIIDKLVVRAWSPEQIANKLKIDNNNKSIVSHKIIYQWLYSVYGERYCIYLESKKTRRKRRSSSSSKPRQLIKDRISIHQRPKVIAIKKQFGHLEGDTLGAPKNSKGTIAGSVEKKTRKLFVIKLSKLKHTVSGFNISLNPYMNVFRTITLDNGVENQRHKDLKLKTYFCDSYSSWQKGQIENSFKRLRRFIPKKTHLTNITNERLQHYAAIMNNTPRKCLNWLTPNEAFDLEITKLRTNK